MKMLTGELTPVADRSTPRSADQTSSQHRIEAEPESADRDQQANQVQQYNSGTDVDTAIVPADGQIPDAPARPRNPRWLWLIPIGAVAVGAILGILPFLQELTRPPDNAIPLPAPATPQEMSKPPSTALEPPPPSATPTPSPTSRRPSAAPQVTQITPTSSPAPGPILLGPTGDNGLETMVQRYCDRHGGGLADPRHDGRWQCSRLLSASIADLDIACRDTYDSAAYAQTLNADDPYAWRCYR